MKINKLVLGFATIAMSAMAQPNTEITEAGTKNAKPVRDGFYDRTLHLEKMPLPYEYVNQRDVFWEKRIWREIDVRQQRNHIFTYSKAYFVDILINAAKKEQITLYSTINDEFTVPLCMDEVMQLGMGKGDTIIVIDPETLKETQTVVFNDFDPTTVIRYRIKEVWFFDSKTSTMKVRILGIAPIIRRFDSEGNFINEGAMFWAYFPDTREMLAQQEAFNAQNDGARLSWDDVFEARIFESYITKESNVHDRRIQDYKAGEDALVEGEKIKDGMFNFEQDLWER